MVGPLADVVELSQEAKCTQKHRKVTGPEAKISPREYVKALILKALIEKLTGRKIKLLIPGDSETEEQVETAATAQGQGQAVEPQQGWGIEIDHYVSRYEYEKTIFEAGGVVKTADRRTIIFSLEVGLSREWLEEQRTSIRLGDAERLADPLVINLSGPAAGLTNAKFAFDIDSDGSPEEISFVSPGSGFLALDSNGDGVINTGAELFGPSTCDGFGELAAYDEDRNNWIDEADSIFGELRVWSKDGQGNDSLSTLGQKGIGAIYLNHIDTLFDVNDQQNQLQGQLKSSGIYLREDGTPGVIHQADLVV